MTLNKAVKVLDGVIPEPLNKMVDQAHLDIALAWKTVKEHLDFQDKEGVCPACGSQIEYEGNEQTDGGGVRCWICPACGTTGKEGYDEVFDGHHYNVRDAAGKPLPGRKEES